MSSSLCLPRVIHLGCGSVQKIGETAAKHHATHVFVVTGSLLQSGTLRSQLEENLKKHGIQATFFSHVKGEPTSKHLQEALAEIHACKADCIVAIGGGSVIDLAKAISVFAIHKDCSLDDIATMKIVERVPLIAVPTTAGTGSEATKVMVITDAENGVKKNPGHPSLIPDAAILDPQLTVSLPKEITASTGLDALAHAIEAYVSTRATTMSDHYALEAIRMIAEALPRAYEDGNDIGAREKMLLGSCYAGIAFSNSSTNLAHAAARPLGARFHIPHGICVALLLPFVIEYGLEASEERYAKIAQAMGIAGGSEADLARNLVRYIQQYNSTFHIWETGLSYIDNAARLEEALPTLVEDALSGNGIVTNQKIPTEKDVEKIYKNLWLELQKYAVV
ncbi:iron-containing alcohol dehydrogenase [Bacillus sp. 165]|uniref:iron-containing alcohol dehydrogenase n=1 Tax=Bacillus sp. 165 TaxID=1529117 RepID=UPI001ADD329B|nr:iron-containing alcohol dehydrogenase [Bacillus sp. 165]MBO9131475.1 iron-containing alcohol dehydrogenase [Bacillus sp. 165]